MDIGALTFGTLLTDPYTGERVTQHERLSEVVDGAVLAEQLGFAWYALGEHHFGERDLIPSPQVVLGAIAERTTSITLATGTTLVANRDPVLVAEDYATVDLLSDGRLQLIAGASFYEEPYEVFGQDPESKPARKRENLELILRLWAEDRVSWEGQFRPPLRDVHLQPRLLQTEPPVWVSGGAKPDSVHLAVDLGLPMVMGTVARSPEANAPMFTLYRELWAEHGRPPEAARTGAASHVFVAETSQQARAQWREYLANYFRDATVPGGASRPAFDFDALIAGQAICGSPAEVVDRIGRMHELWDHDLHLLTIDLGGIPARTVARAMELVGSEVIPQVTGLGRHATVAADA
ncbi:LLM class flavin-dependent oxidoreductase [Frankia tisae]|uniref:LLM class flavin-dependent oxidoreductase n=1 Tax=Frankia tisae TaxID=2950104 RepID=UPI0021C064E0|nr:LLM class flavin-dependent oxidoreductase [Frankia tisae]